RRQAREDSDRQRRPALHACGASRARRRAHARPLVLPGDSGLRLYVRLRATRSPAPRRPRATQLPSFGGGQWGRSRRSSPKAREMLRLLVYVAAPVALLAVAIMYGGNAIGAWDPLPPAPTPPPAVKLAKAKPKDNAAATKTSTSTTG